VYGFVLSAHNLIRWLAVLGALAATLRAARGWAMARPWENRDRQAALLFVVGMDLQALSGLLLMVMSPLVRAAVGRLSQGLQAGEARFLLVEHVPLTVLALVLAHAGSAVTRRVRDDRARHRRAAILFGLASLALVLAVPWWRPLLPGLGMA
jgi:hypothetical protein